MLGNPEVPDILPMIRRLAEGRIEMHAQIVLCPGINDGEYLERSVNDLSAFYPHVKSLALVPVGLTRFRSRLPRMRPIGKAYSAKIIQLVDRWQKIFRRKFGTGFVYAADEFFTKAGLGMPPKRYYDEFYQVENGVGMVRQFLDDFKSKRKLLPRRLKNNLTLTIVTGVSAFRLIKQLVEEHLSWIPGLRVQLVRVENAFFGHSVSVTGLLSGKDIIAALKKKRHLGDLILLPPNCINQDGLFLDDLTPADVEKESGCKVAVGSYDLVQTLTRLLREFRSED
jgi:putative radical SAM enzyme (TIGR03279 family)